MRNSLIPVLVSYFQERYQTVKWRGFKSSTKRITGGGPQGATLGILEYLSQSNNNANCVGQDERFKFVDDLSVLEIVNLLTVGICSTNVRQQVPNDMLENNQYIPPENLKSQEYLDKINEWTKNQKMEINSTKTKTIIFTFTNNFQFRARLKLNEEIVETVTETKLLGTMITSDMKWKKTQTAL